MVDLLSVAVALGVHMLAVAAAPPPWSPRAVGLLGHVAHAVGLLGRAVHAVGLPQAPVMAPGQPQLGGQRERSGPVCCGAQDPVGGQAGLCAPHGDSWSHWRDGSWEPRAAAAAAAAGATVGDSGGAASPARQNSGGIHEAITQVGHEKIRQLIAQSMQTAGSSLSQNVVVCPTIQQHICVSTLSPQS